jgi:hypothetical protein
MAEEPALETPSSQSHLFTIRVWWEEAEQRQPELRMQVRHVLTGEIRYFRDAPALLAYLAGKLDAPDIAVDQA